jgi:hypothetical protein
MYRQLFDTLKKHCNKTGHQTVLFWISYNKKEAAFINHNQAPFFDLFRYSSDI